MPFEHQVTPYENSVLSFAQEQEKICGFDGKFSLSDNHRIWLDVANVGEKAMLLKVIKYLNLEPAQANSLVWKMLRTENDLTVKEIESAINGIMFNQKK